MKQENFQFLGIIILALCVTALAILVRVQNLAIAELTHSVAELSGQVNELASDLISSDLPLSNIVYAHAAKPGDKVAGFEVVSVEPLSGEVASQENARIVFSGSAEVTGDYEYYFSELLNREDLCLTLTDESELSKLPQLGGHEEIDTFCFRNLESAVGSFGPDFGRGQATVLIEGFVIEFGPGSLGNSAELVERM